MAAISLFMDACNQVPLILRKLHNQKSLTLWWQAFSRCGMEHFAFSFYYKGGQYFVHDVVQPIAPQITQIHDQQ